MLFRCSICNQLDRHAEHVDEKIRLDAPDQRTRNLDGVQICDPTPDQIKQEPAYSQPLASTVDEGGLVQEPCGLHDVQDEYVDVCAGYGRRIAQAQDWSECA